MIERIYPILSVPEGVVLLEMHVIIVTDICMSPGLGKLLCNYFRSDVIVQKLVYKLVPGLLVSELRRRREHKGGKEDVKGVENVSEAMALEVTDMTNAAAAAEQPTILSLDDVVSLSIEYFTR